MSDALVSDHRRRHPPYRRPKTAASDLPYAGPPKRRCQCGVCPACRDAAKWERIFQEKFADPDYYGVRQVRFGSSLSWLG
jgi:hypothetical protein